MSRKPPVGVTLVEVMVTVLILAIAITAALEITATHRRSSTLAEQRRSAFQASVAKVDQMRVMLTNGLSPDAVFQLFGPFTITGTESTAEVEGATGDIVWMQEDDGEGNDVMTDPDRTGGVLACFSVGEDANNNGVLDPSEDLNGNNILNQYLPQLGDRPMGTVVFITDENPEESTFGDDYSQAENTAPQVWYERNPFGVDINGNGSLMDGPSSASTPAPFPLDLNGDGDTTDTDIRFAFRVLPVVVVIQWNGPYGPERIDHFSILTRDIP